MIFDPPAVRLPKGPPAPPTRDRSERITRRDRTMIQCIIDGLKNKEIAVVLGLAENTVKIYTSRLYDKLNVKDRWDLARWGRAHAEAQRRIHERYRELHPEEPEQPPTFRNLEIPEYDVFCTMARVIPFTREQIAEVIKILYTK